MAVNDQRGQLPKESFRKFLDDTVPIDRGMMRGRDVLIHITMLPVTLAVAGTLIGLICSVVRAGSQPRLASSPASHDRRLACRPPNRKHCAGRGESLTAQQRNLYLEKASV